MANSYSPILQLAKPAAGDVDWDDEINGNVNKLDKLLWQKLLSATREVTATVQGSGAVGPQLSPSTQYFYRVTATNAFGETDTLVEADALQGVTAYPIQVNWVSVTGATGYKVYKGVSTGVEFLLATVGITTTYTDDGNTAVTGTPFPTSNTAKVLTESDTVDGIHAATTPAPNVLVPLDSSGRYQAANGSLITSLTPANMAPGTIAVGVELSEVVTARGTEASLDVRLDASLNEDGTIKPAAIPDASIVVAKLATNAVETIKIKDENVTAPKLATDAVTTVKILAQNVTEPKMADNAASTRVIADQAVTLAKLSIALQASLANATPIGTIVAYGGIVEPVGWIECEGRAMPQVGNGSAVWGTFDAAPLYAAIGSKWGTPGGGQFNAPDLRGVVLRGWTHTAGDAFVDPNAATRIARIAGGAVGNDVGTFQQDGVGVHQHSYTDQVYNFGVGGGGSGNPGSQFTNTTTGGPTTPETRGKNAYVMYIMKVA